MTALLPKIFLSEDRHKISPMDSSIGSDRGIHSFNLEVKVVLSSEVVKHDFGIENLMEYAI